MSAILESVPSFANATKPVEARPRAVTIDSRRLLADSKLIHINHRGEVYALRETRLGKLILTK